MFDELARECLDRRKKSDLEEYNGTDYDFWFFYLLQTILVQ